MYDIYNYIYVAKIPDMYTVASILQPCQSLFVLAEIQIIFGNSVHIELCGSNHVVFIIFVNPKNKH